MSKTKQSTRFLQEAQSQVSFSFYATISHDKHELHVSLVSGPGSSVSLAALPASQLWGFRANAWHRVGTPCTLVKGGGEEERTQEVQRLCEGDWERNRENREL